MSVISSPSAFLLLLWVSLPLDDDAPAADADAADADATRTNASDLAKIRIEKCCCPILAIQ